MVVSILETTSEHGAIEGKTQTNPTKFQPLEKLMLCQEKEKRAKDKRNK